MYRRTLGRMAKNFDHPSFFFGAALLEDGRAVVVRVKRCGNAVDVLGVSE